MTVPQLDTPPNVEQPDTEQPSAAKRAPTLLHAFSYAGEGIWYLIGTQRNAKIHTAIAIGVVLMGALLQIDRLEWVMLVLIIALVIAAEGFNTALEALVDLASPTYHPLAKVAKDVAAGAVLLTAIAAVVIGMLIFLPRLLTLAQLWL
jgi:diacylglycerol kinase (ATP)